MFEPTQKSKYGVDMLIRSTPSRRPAVPLRADTNPSYGEKGTSYATPKLLLDHHDRLIGYRSSQIKCDTGSLRISEEHLNNAGVDLGGGSKNQHLA